MLIQGIVEVSDALLDQLKIQARQSTSRRARYCLHVDSDDPVNEMILVMCSDSYIQPHRHPLGKTESYLVLEGEMDVFIYTDAGEVAKTICMGAVGSGKTFLYRLSEPYWHAPVAKTPTVTFVEVYSGPFDKIYDVEYAPWAIQESFTP